jgi:hypothetical protein
MTRDPPSILAPTPPPNPPAPLPPTGLSSLWQRLDGLRRQQLAQHLAELIRRLPPIGGALQEESDHESV